MSEMKRSSCFQFVPGVLIVRKEGYGSRNGSGYLTFNEDDIDIHPHDESAGNYIWVLLEESELIALRDFLTKEFPPQPQEAAHAPDHG